MKKRHISGRVVAGYLKRRYQGETFMTALLELIKNSLDWSASKIDILTEHAGLTIVDDGIGMNEENQIAFCSINGSTGTEAWQHAQYGTGSKMFLMAYAKAVHVTTRLRNAPNQVVSFGFSSEVAEKVAFNSEQVEVTEEALKSNRALWPYDFPHGTALAYTFAESDDPSIFRGEELARELTARLPTNFSRIIRVNGNPIPQKDIKGSAFTYEGFDEVLGDMNLTLYIPQKKAKSDGLFVTGGRVPEAPFVEFHKIVASANLELHPAFLDPTLCGNVSLSALKGYIREDRKTISTRLRRDDKFERLVERLNELGEEIAIGLDLKLESNKQTNDEEQALVEILSLLNETYDPENIRPIKPGGKTKRKVKQENGVPKSDKAVRLELTRDEFEPGEAVHVIAHIRPDFAEHYTQLDWDISESLCMDAKANPLHHGVDMIAGKKLGHGRVTVNIPKTNHEAVAEYDVVAVRKPKLSLMQARIGAPGSLKIRVLNADKITDKIFWKLEGEKIGRLTPADNGESAELQTDPENTGEAKIVAYNKTLRLECKISTYWKPQDSSQLVVTIGDHHFEVVNLNLGEAAPPVDMAFQPGDLNALYINMGSKMVTLARQKGWLLPVLQTAIAARYGRFREYDVSDDTGGVDLEVLRRMETVAMQIMSEVLEHRNHTKESVAV